MSRQAEKEYLKRSGTISWEQSKPFAPKGEVSLEEGLHLIQEFGACLGLLQAEPEHRILDLGAGGCWVSDGLQRLGLSTVAVDISYDLLTIGRSRLLSSGPARVVTGDAEALPFASGVFDRVVCLNSFHHVPNIPAALAEVARVLNRDGLAVFSEPGVGHSSRAQSRRAVQEFGVQEADIDPTVFLSQCQTAGFAEVVLEPFGRILPGHGLTRDMWRTWRQLAAVSRPRRAVATLRKGFFELLGMRKDSDLFVEAFTSDVLRVLHASMQHHPIVVASKRPLSKFLASRADSSEVSARIVVLQAPSQLMPGQTAAFRIELRNTGSFWWKTNAGSARPVRLGIQLLDSNLRLIDRDYARHSLPHDLAPDDSVVMSVPFSAPGDPGRYLVKIDLLLEGVWWFETRGSKPAIHAVAVEP